MPKRFPPESKRDVVAVARRVIDVCSNRIVGYSISHRMTARLCGRPPTTQTGRGGSQRPRHSNFDPEQFVGCSPTPGSPGRWGISAAIGAVWADLIRLSKDGSSQNGCP
jgi:transposase InsO family protein